MDFLIGLLLLTSKKRISSVQYHREVEKSTLNSTRSVLHVAAIFRQEVTYRVKLKSRKFVRWRLDCDCYSRIYSRIAWQKLEKTS